MAGTLQSSGKHIESEQMLNTQIQSSNVLDLEKLELMAILQSTLDLKSQLKYFLENLRTKLRIDGLCFIEEERQLKIKIGRQSTHSCGYHLTKEETTCGELVFKRSTRFSEKDLEIIEDSILLLLVPISNALKYQDAVKKSSFNPMRNIIERQILMSTLNREIELAKRHNHPLSLLSIKVGAASLAQNTVTLEEILQPLYKSFQVVSSSTDMWFRISASEFLLLTHGTLTNAKKIAAEFLQLEDAGFDKGFEANNLTLKVGVASLTGTDSINSLIKRSQQPAKLTALA